MRKTSPILIGSTIALAVLLSASSCDTADSGTEKDQKSTNTQLDLYQKNQPVPLFPYSQYRQTVIDVESAQVSGVATTTFFFNQGIKDPIFTCPSIGFPVASTAQLTNPDQAIWHSSSGSAVISQQEPNGVYTGDSSGTNVVCVASDGTAYLSYAEEFAHTVGAPAHWDAVKGSIVLDGAPTVTSTDVSDK